MTGFPSLNIVVNLYKYNGLKNDKNNLENTGYMFYCLI